MVDNWIWQKVGKGGGKRWQSGKNVFSTCRQYMIWRYQKIFWENIMWEDLVQSKNLFEFYRFFLCEFSGPKHLIPTEQNLSIPLDQYVFILLVSNTHNENIRTFGTENYAWRFYIIQDLYEFFQSILYDFLDPNCFDTPKIILLKLIKKCLILIILKNTTNHL